jgi:SAM-dependent methyltransferase
MSDLKRKLSTGEIHPREVYEDYWSQLEVYVDENAGEKELSRFIHRVVQSWRQLEGIQPAEALAYGRKVELPACALVPVRNSIIFDQLAARLSSSRPTRVVEIGCGLGHNLFLFYLSGCASLQVSYVGLDITSAAVRLATRIRDLFRLEQFDFRRHNMHDSDIGLEWFDGDTLFYTAHAIEQVPEIQASLIESMLRVSPRVSCVHFEPVGFQLESNSRHGEVGATRDYANSVRHNTNLISTLQGVAASGAIEITGVERDLYGHKIVNGLSVVSWSKVTQDGL